MKKLYPIVVDYSEVDKGGAYGILFPDMPNCFSASDSHDEILDNAREAALLHLSELDELPEPNSDMQSLSKFIKNEYGGKKHSVLLVDVDLSAITGPAKRVNVTIPELALAKIDAAAKSSGKSRSEFLTEAGLSAV